MNRSGIGENVPKEMRKVEYVHLDLKSMVELLMHTGSL